MGRSREGWQRQGNRLGPRGEQQVAKGAPVVQEALEGAGTATNSPTMRALAKGGAVMIEEGTKATGAIAGAGFLGWGSKRIVPFTAAAVGALVGGGLIAGALPWSFTMSSDGSAAAPKR